MALYGQKNKIRGIFLVPRSANVHTGGVSQEVLTEVAATSVAARFGYSRRYQRAHFVRLSFLKHLRRYLLTLGQLRCGLSVMGVIRQFRGYFKALNTPAGQIFQHPLTQGWVVDVAVSLPPGAYVSAQRKDLASRVRESLNEHLVFLDSVTAELTLAERTSRTEAIVVELVNFF